MNKVLTESPTAPGEYENLEMALYHTPPGDSKTLLAKANIAPLAYFVYRNRKGSKETQAFRLGKRFHANFDGTAARDYVVGPEVKSTADKAWKAFVAANPGKIVLKPKEAAEIDAMVKAVKAHKLATELLSIPAWVEKSYYWINALTGRLCKCRPDFITKDLSTVIDLKTAKDPTHEGFRAAAYRHHYYVSAAFTLEGIKAVTGVMPSRYLFLVVQSESPYLVALYEATSEEIMLGADFVRRNLQRLKECEDSGVWPGLPEGIIPLGLPKYANRDAREIETEHALLDEWIS